MIAFLLAQTIAITGGTVYPVSGPKIENATVLIRDGKIAAVGANVAVPAGATRIDASGKWVTPGFIDGAGQMGLREIGAVDNTNEYRLRGNDVAASFNVLEGINPASTLIPVTRVEGVTTTLAAPASGWISGQAVLIDLDGATIEQMLVRSPVGMLVDLSEGSKSAGGGSRAGVAQRLRRVFSDALEYSRRRTEYTRAQMQQLAAPAADLEALLPVLRGQEPLIAFANRRSDMETALRIGREFKLKLILAGAQEGWMIAPELAAAGVPLLVQPLDNIPSYDALGVRYENAAATSLPRNAPSLVALTALISVRPSWVPPSIRPGVTHLPRASMRVASPGTVTAGPTAVIRPSRIRTVAFSILGPETG